MNGFTLIEGTFSPNVVNHVGSQNPGVSMKPKLTSQLQLFIMQYSEQIDHISAGIILQ